MAFTEKWEKDKQFDIQIYLAIYTWRGGGRGGKEAIQDFSPKFFRPSPKSGRMIKSLIFD